MAVTWTKMRHRHPRGDVIHVRQRALTFSSVFYENGEHAHSGHTLALTFTPNTFPTGRVFFVYDLTHAPA